MIDFYVTLPSGEIVMTGSCPEDQLHLQQHAGCTVRVGRTHPATHYWDNGLVEFPTRPSLDHAFDFAVKQWTITTDKAWAAVRADRDARLAQCDWVVSRALEQGTSVPVGWLVYRQALRDVTQQPDPINLTWPKLPEP